MPLDRVVQEWSDKLSIYKLPSSCGPMKFHRSYSPELHQALGATPSLDRWRDVFQNFLLKKIPVGKANEFKWVVKEGDLMTPDEITDVVSLTTYQYSLERS